MSKIFATPVDYEEAKYRMRNLPDNRVGAPWTAAEDTELIARFNSGMTLIGISLIHKRNPGGIIERLKKLNLVEYSAIENAHVHKYNNSTTYYGPSISTMIENPWASSPYSTTISNTCGVIAQPLSPLKFTESITMTKPLEHKAFLFGSDITTLSSETIVNHIKRANEEINSYASVPDNNYTKMRVANLQDAILAAVKELNKRGE